MIRLLHTPIVVVNCDADSESYIEDRFKIDQLESLNESVATFGLIFGFNTLNKSFQKKIL